MYHYAIVDRNTNRVRFIGSRPEPLEDNDPNELYVELDFHDSSLINMKYKNGIFVKNE